MSVAAVEGGGPAGRGVRSRPPSAPPGRAADAGVAVDEQPACFSRIAAEGQDRLDVCFLRQQNVSIRLDRIVKAEGSAKVWVVRLECCWLRPLRVKDRENVGDPPALVA